MDANELFENAKPFNELDLGGDNPQIDSILDELVVITGFSEDGSSMTIEIVKKDGKTEKIWSSSKVVNDTIKKIGRMNGFPVKATFREFNSKKTGQNYYALE